jgi:hypothetical protein
LQWRWWEKINFHTLFRGRLENFFFLFLLLCLVYTEQTGRWFFKPMCCGKRWKWDWMKSFSRFPLFVWKSFIFLGMKKGHIDRRTIEYDDVRREKVQIHTYKCTSCALHFIGIFIWHYTPTSMECNVIVCVSVNCGFLRFTL